MIKINTHNYIRGAFKGEKVCLNCAKLNHCGGITPRSKCSCGDHSFSEKENLYVID